MSLELLDKTRKINKLLTEQESDKVDFRQFCEVLSRELHVNVLITSKKGKVLGLEEYADIGVFPKLKDAHYGEYIDTALKDRFMSILSTKENVNLLTIGLECDNIIEYQAMVAPVCMSGKRLGTLFIYRKNDVFSIDDIILTEYGTTVIGLAMQRAESEEVSVEYHKEQDIRAAVKTLSRLEAHAMICVLEELGGKRKGILITSRLADKVGITRSVIVNALKKCESAGIIETKSSGMKGTTIHIVNDLLCEDIITQNI